MDQHHPHRKPLTVLALWLFAAIACVAQNYRNVVVLGNTMALHERNSASGWFAGRGMASTVECNDFVHRLEQGLQAKEPAAKVVPVNITAWEKAFDTNDERLVDPYLKRGVDCIVFRAGDFVPAGNIEDFEAATVKLLEHCLSKCPKASLYVTTTFWLNERLNKALYQVSQHYHIALVDIRTNRDDCMVRTGDFVWGDSTSDEGKTFHTDHPVLYDLGKGIANHPNDVGMLFMANQLLTAMNYAKVEALHKVKVLDSNGVGCTCFDRWVEKGVFTFQTAGLPSAKDSFGRIIPITDQRFGAYTLTMPSTDIVLTIEKRPSMPLKQGRIVRKPTL